MSQEAPQLRARARRVRAWRRTGSSTIWPSKAKTPCDVSASARIARARSSSAGVGAYAARIVSTWLGWMHAVAAKPLATASSCLRGETREIGDVQIHRIDRSDVVGAPPRAARMTARAWRHRGTPVGVPARGAAERRHEILGAPEQRDDVLGRRQSPRPRGCPPPSRTARSRRNRAAHESRRHSTPWAASPCDTRSSQARRDPPRSARSRIR